MQTKNQIDLKLFVDSAGILWFHSGSKRATPSEQPIHEVISSGLLSRADRIRLLGCYSNADLICQLWEHQTKIPAEVQLGTPAVCTGENRKDPDVVFRQMECLGSVPSSLGGMHKMTSNDYVSYNLVRKLQQGVLPTIEHMGWHPAWPAVSYVFEQLMPTPKGKSHEEAYSVVYSRWQKLPAYSATLKMLASIIDPRWYIDRNHPDRLSKLKMYMGLTPKHVRNVWNGLEGSSTKETRARTVINAWTNGERKTPRSRMNRFLWQLAAANGEDAMALRASSSYLSFIRNVWLHNMRSDGRTLFVPEYFFPTTKEADNYASHFLRWSLDYEDY